jgi:hypothetical protein
MEGFDVEFGIVAPIAEIGVVLPDISRFSIAPLKPITLAQYVMLMRA